MFRRDVKMRSDAKPKPITTLVKKTPISLVRDDDTVKFSAYEMNIDATSGIFPTLDNCFLCIGKDGIIRKVDGVNGKIVAESERVLSLVRAKPLQSPLFLGEVEWSASIGPNLLSLPNNKTLLYGSGWATSILFDSTSLKQLKAINQSFQEVHVLSSSVILAKETYKEQAELIRIDEAYKSLGTIPFKSGQEWMTLKNLLIVVKGNTLVFKSRLHDTDFVKTAKLKIDGFGFLKPGVIHKLRVYPNEQLISFVISTSSLDQHKAVIVDVANIHEPRILREFKDVYDIYKLPRCPAFLLQQLGDTTHGKDLGDKSLVWDYLGNELHSVRYIDLRAKTLARTPATGSLAYVTKDATKIHFIDSVTLKPQLKKTAVGEEKKPTPLTSLGIMKEKPKPKSKEEYKYEYSDSNTFTQI